MSSNLFRRWDRAKLNSGLVSLVRLDWPWLVKMVEYLAVLIYNIAEYFGWLGFLTTCSIL